MTAAKCRHCGKVRGEHGMSEKSNPPMDPAKTILVLKCQGREVGRILETAPNASAYLEVMNGYYSKKEGGMQVDYESATMGGLLALLKPIEDTPCEGGDF